ncbi:hypothetical protein [Achromobacter spanius]|uniref:tetratricopeptide repeat protein n=1 Tax=Achromobacter spanius TaxID=217203 RepID=UPI003819B283
MGIFSRLFGTKKSPQDLNVELPPTESPTADLEGRGGNVQIILGMLSVSTPKFFGKASVASNKQWILGLSDSNVEGRGGHQASGNGTVVLVNASDDKVAWTSNVLERPSDGAVADTGDTLIYDAGSRADLSGTVVAFDRSGDVRFSRRYSANIFALAISSCGRYGAVQTLNAPGSGDSNILEVLDIELGKIQFSVTPVTTWSTAYTFTVGPDGLKKLWIHLPKLGKFAYLGSGEFVDTKKYRTSRLEKGSYAVVLQAAKELLEETPTVQCAVIAQAASERALADKAIEPSWEAVGHRVRAEALEIQGKLSEAVHAYDEALRINPKIGVKRKVDHLRKKLIAG